MRGGGVQILSLSFAIVLVATAVLAARAATPAPLAPPPIGVPEVDTGKTCYLPAEPVTIILRNVGTGFMFLGYKPNFLVWNETLGYVREATDGFPHVATRIGPGENITWVWDSKWDRFDNANKGNYVPAADYFAIVQVLVGFPQPELVELGRAPFSIGGCVAQITAGDDFQVDEGQPFAFDPVIEITGNAEVTSVTWDLDPATDTSGDGNATNDVDLVGANATYAFGDDGIYRAVMNLRGFGQVGSKTRLDQDVVFVLDSSGSMVTSDPLNDRKTAAKAYTDRLAPDDRAAVVDFDDDAFLVGGHGLTMDYAQVKRDIDMIDSLGGSCLACGIRLGSRELQNHGDPESVWLEIFMTDGDSTAERDFFEIPRAVQIAKSLGVKIFVVGLRVPDPYMEDRLRDIANETGGRYFPAPSKDALDQIMADIGEDVNKTEDRYFVVSDDVVVTVRNVDPTVVASVDVAQAPPVNLTLRVAGEKFHDVRFDLLRDGTSVANATVLRMPGSPDAQAATIWGVLHPGNANAARLVYTPLDDLVNGQVNGADPAWVNVTLPNGTFVSFHHTFNVEHPDTWVWEIDMSAVTPGELAVASANVAVDDPGSDDIAIAIDWGDGRTDARTVYFDGVGPDPYPSPGGGTVSLLEVLAHGYVAAGTYTITISVADDDGGVATVTLSVVVT